MWNRRQFIKGLGMLGATAAGVFSRLGTAQASSRRQGGRPQGIADWRVYKDGDNGLSFDYGQQLVIVS